MTLWYFVCTLRGTLLVVDSLCEVLIKYTIGINPSIIQFRSTPESIKAIKVDWKSGFIFKVILVYRLCFCTIVILFKKISKSSEVCGVKMAF